MERGTPSTRKRGFPPSKPPTFPSTAWGCRPKTPLAPLARHGFVSQKNFRGLPSVFSAFKSAFVAFPACFRVSKVLLRLSRRDFALQKHFRCFPLRVFRVQKHFCGLPGVFPGFKNTFAASPTRFRASKALFSFGSNKNQYIEEFLWQRL
ncbi:MAG: hypothetical protein K2J50_00345 [Treponemataceae bacterium]|nr:hypothetical protein [Treponemataceae bacterium]